MRLGIFAAARPLDVPDLLADAAAAAEAGFPSYWLPQLRQGADALTTLAAIGREVADLELGTAVVPTWPRHPLTLAQQALTTSTLVDGRLALGVGLSHQPVVENTWGYRFETPLRHAREYLDVLGPALRNQPVDVEGRLVTGRSGPIAPDSPAPSLLLAALGPRMLELAGTVADGTVLWMTGPKTIETHTAPTIRKAAEEAGRDLPRIVVGVPVLCTDDVDQGHDLAARQFELYGQLPSYRAMLDREGLAGPAELAVVGDEEAVGERLARFSEAGADDILCVEFGHGPDDLARTRSCLAQLL